MSTFQILMFAATLFFAYQIYRHVQELEDKAPVSESQVPDSSAADAGNLVEQADEAYGAGDVDRAKNLLGEAYRANPENCETLNKFAFVTAKTGETREAIELYERSLALDENDDLTHNAIASLYRLEGAYERAQDHYLKALAIDDAYAATFYNYANLLVDMGEKEEARSMYERALELQNDFPEAHEALESLGREV